MENSAVVFACLSVWVTCPKADDEVLPVSKIHDID